MKDVHWMMTAVAMGVLLLGMVRADAATPAPLRKELLEQDWFPKAPPLPEPTGKVTKVNTVRELYRAARGLEEGETILVADGRYKMTHSLYLRKAKATLRGESGDRTRVILDFKNSRHGEGVCVSYATDVTIADLTVENVTQNSIKINSNHNVHRVTVYNVVSHNVWQRHIKGPGVPDKDGKPQWNQGCRVQYCLFYNDRAKQRGDEPYEDRHPGFGFNYVGGMDIMSADGWVISDNVFMGIHGKTGEGRGAIFMWRNGKNCTIERNIFIDCDCGICLGNSSGRGERRHCTGFVVRNNFVTRCPEVAILADHTRNCKILNNTVHDPKSRLHRLVRVLHANDGLVVKNNLFSGPGVRIAKYPEGVIDVQNNLVKIVPEYFVDAENGNLHLTEKAVEAIDKALPLEEVTADIDGQRRGDKPDLGADELGRPEKE
jgi:parallel beta-helix repeat protein